MLQHSLKPVGEICCATCGGSVASSPEAGAPLYERLLSDLHYTVFLYRYHFLKEWYRTRSE